MIVLSILMKAAIGLLAAALIFQLIGFASPYWNSGTYSNFGLWQSCIRECTSYSANSAVGAVRAFETIAFIVLAVILLLLLYYCCKDPNLQILLATSISSFVAAGLIFLGILIWVIDGYKHGLSWAFYFCVIAAVLAIIGGILLIPERRSRIIIVGGSTGAVRTTKTTTTVTVTRR